MEIPVESKTFLNHLCIICQKRKRKVKETSTKNGMDRIRYAASFKEDDEVSRRLLLLDSQDSFSYHVDNQCFGAYVRHYNPRTEPLQSLENNENFDLDTRPVTPPHCTRSKRLRKPNKKNKSITCIICGQLSFKQSGKLHVLQTNSRAKKLYRATRLLQDDVFTKTSLMNNEDSFLAAKLKYHNNCLRMYEYKYERCKHEATHMAADKSLKTDSVL